MMSTNNSLQNQIDECRKEEDSVEFWFARDLMSHFEYSSWESFEKVIHKAALNAKAVDVAEDDHFRQVTKMVHIGSGATREVTDYMVTRYGAYLVALNADSSKKNVAYLKNYFVVQARKQELIEKRVQDAERLESRNQLKATEKALSGLFHERGLDGPQMAKVRAKGDQALFGGHTTQQMKDKYGIAKSRPLSDFLPSVTIAAKSLINEMTKLNVEANNTQGETAITSEHVQNSTSVRDMLGSRGIKPEQLPADEDINKVERRLAQEERKLSASNGLPPLAEADD